MTREVFLETAPKNMIQDMINSENSINTTESNVFKTVFISHFCSFFYLITPGAVSIKDMLFTDDFVLIVVIH